MVRVVVTWRGVLGVNAATRDRSDDAFIWFDVQLPDRTCLFEPVRVRGALR